MTPWLATNHPSIHAKDHNFPLNGDRRRHVDSAYTNTSSVGRWVADCHWRLSGTDRRIRSVLWGATAFSRFHLQATVTLSTQRKYGLDLRRSRKTRYNGGTVSDAYRMLLSACDSCLRGLLAKGKCRQNCIRLLCEYISVLDPDRERHNVCSVSIHCDHLHDSDPGLLLHPGKLIFLRRFAAENRRLDARRLQHKVGITPLDISDRRSHVLIECGIGRIFSDNIDVAPKPIRNELYGDPRNLRLLDLPSAGNRKGKMLLGIGVDSPRFIRHSRSRRSHSIFGSFRSSYRLLRRSCRTTRGCTGNHRRRNGGS